MCEVHRKEPVVHRSTKPPKKSEAKGKEEINFKDSERKAPDSVQSTTRMPLKKLKINTVMHSYGGEVGIEGAAPNALSWKLFERLRKKRAEDKARQCEVKEIDPQVTDCRDTVIVGVDVEMNAKDDDFAKDPTKQCHEAAPDNRLSRKRLREELHEQAWVSRRKLIPWTGTIDQAKPMPNKFRIQGNDAITRLLNVGRLHQAGSKMRQII